MENLRHAGYYHGTEKKTGKKENEEETNPARAPVPA